MKTMLLLLLAGGLALAQLGPTPGGAASGDLCGTYPAPSVCTATNALFTTPFIATHYGGSLSGSTATIRGTSNGSPSAAYLFLQSNGQNTSIGSSTAPDSLLTINLNAAAAPPALNGILHVIGADATSILSAWDAFGTGVFPVFVMRAARGTGASPTATQNTDSLGQFSFAGYDGTGFHGSNGFTAVATENWTSTTRGAKVQIATTKNGTTTTANALVADNDGQLYAPSLVNVTTAASGALCYNSSTGRFTYDGSNTCLASSAKYKHAIAAFQNSALAIVAQLVPVTFQYNANLGMLAGQHIGLIAEDVAKAAPALVAPSAAAPDKINIQDLVAVLVKAVQEQQLEIVALQAAINGHALSVSTFLPVPVITYTPPVIAAFVPPTYNPAALLAPVLP